MIKRLKTFLSFCLFTILVMIAGCVAPLIGGTVYDKIFTPEHTQRASYTVSESEYRRIYDNDDGKYEYKWVTYDVTKWTSVDVPDTYTIFIKGTNKDDKPLTESHEVSKEVYDSLKIGDWYRIPEAK